MRKLKIDKSMNIYRGILKEASASTASFQGMCKKAGEPGGLLSNIAATHIPVIGGLVKSLDRDEGLGGAAARIGLHAGGSATGVLAGAGLARLATRLAGINRGRGLATIGAALAGAPAGAVAGDMVADRVIESKQDS